MATVDELTGPSGGMLHDALDAGIADLSQQTTVPFTIYQKIVLPLDGFVFWLRLSSFDQAGAIHWMSEREEEETETRAHNSVLFTTSEHVQNLNMPNTQTIVVGDIEGRRYAFGRHGWFFPQAGVWHYQGDGIPSSMDSQLIDDPAQLDTSKLIVSGSLPAWLALATYDPVWIAWPVDRNPHITLYPSYLVPDNIEPPYGVVHIEPPRTEALQVAPWLSNTYSHYQLTREAIRVTLYGINNDQAADFLDLVEQYTLDTNAFGILNMPTIRDGKRPWPPGMIIAQQKLLDFEVSYVQTRINAVARQLILDAEAQVFTDDRARTAGLLDPEAQGAVHAAAIILASTGAILSGAGAVAASLGPLLRSAQGTLGGAAGIAGLAVSAVPLRAAAAAAAGITGALGVLPATAVVRFQAAAGITAACRVLTAASAALPAAAGLAALPALRPRLAASAPAAAGMSGATVQAAVASAQAAAAGGLAVQVILRGRAAAEVDGAGGIAGDIDPIHGSGGANAWFMSGAVAGAGGLAGAPSVLTRGGVAGETDAAGSVASGPVIALGGLARATGLGSLSGDAHRLSYAGGESDAAATSAANPAVAVRLPGGETDAAAMIAGNPLRGAFAGAESDATAAIAGIIGGALRAAGESDAQAGVSAAARIAGPSGQIAGAAGLTGALTVRAGAAGTLGGAAGVSGALNSSFSSGFSSGFGLS